MEAAMQLRVDADGSVRCLYDERIDVTALGVASIRRASYVEPDAEGAWWADLSPVAGPQLGPFHLRSQALDAERDWLEAHWLSEPSMPIPCLQ
jgi:hypothetical protein